jgi:hypothetical protein
MRMPGDDARVAGEFLVVPEAARRQVHERVEPEQAAQQCGDGIGMQVAALGMDALVRQHQHALRFAIARVEIGRQHHPGAQQADRRRQRARRRFRLQVAAARHESSEAMAEAELGKAHRDGERQGPEQPRRHQPGLPRRAGIARRLHRRQDRRHDDRHRQFGEARRGRRHRCGDRDHGHQRPARIRHARAARAPERPAHREHQRDGEAGGKRRLEQHRQDLMAGHRRSPRAGAAIRRCPCG